MRALDRKLGRDLFRLKTQAAAIALLCASAVAIFVGATSTHRALLRSQAGYYQHDRFADLFAAVRRAPETLAARLATIPGVAEVETRIVAEIRVELGGVSEPVSAQAVSLPRDRQPRLNRLHLRAGRQPRPEAGDEVLASEGFALANRLRPGDTLTVVINGRRQHLRLVGVALSPEYVYVIRAGDLLPDDHHFGVLWMDREALARALDLEGAFNSVAMQLGRAASQPAVIEAVDRLLAPYGGVGAVGRDQHVSNRFVSDEIKQLRATAVIVPAIFLGVATILLSVVLSRLIATERQLIGTLKALGYSSAAVGVHYAKLVTLIVLLGALAGTAAGWWLGRGWTRMYTDYFRFPLLAYRLEPSTVVLAVLLSLATSLAGVARTVLRAARLPPAEVMRPEPPATYRASWLERLGVGRLLSPPGRMILRHLARHRLRAGLTVIGTAAGVAIIVTGAFFFDAMDYMMELQFGRAMREDATVTFTHPLPRAGLLELRRAAGVRDGEPFRALAATLRAGHRSRQTAILGLAEGARLHRLVDAADQVVAIPPAGLLLSSTLADILRVAPGDAVRVEVLEGRRQVGELRVVAEVDDLLGVSAYMSLTALSRLLGDEDLVSGAFLALDAAAEDSVYAHLRSLPRVAGVTLSSAMVEAYRKTLSEHLLAFSAILVMASVLIAAGVVYNAGRVSLAERERELATLRVIGMTRGETWLILAGELAVLALGAIPLGCALGYGLAALSIAGMSSDLYRVPLVVEPSTFAFAATVVLLATAAVALLLRLRVARLDLVTVLKTKE